MNATNHEYYSSLARSYILNRMTVEERMSVHSLILQDPNFCTTLKDELELCRQLQGIKHDLTPKVKNRIYHQVKQASSRKSFAKYLLTLTLKATVPILNSPFINLQRRVFE